MQLASENEAHLRQPVQREVHLKDLFAVVRRHWKIVVIIAGLVSGGAWYASRNAVPQYQSRLTVQISSPKQVFARLDDIDVDEFALKTDPILSEALVLTTQGLALRVVESLELQLEISDPTKSRRDYIGDIHVDTDAPPAHYELEFRGPAGWGLYDTGGILLAEGAPEDLVAGPGFRFRLARSDLSDQRISFDVNTPEVAASWVSAGVSYRVRDGTNAVDINFTGTDPALVPRILNQTALELRNSGADRARAIAQNKRRYISDQLQQSSANYEDKLTDLQRYKERFEITDLSAEARATIGSLHQLELDRQQLLIEIATVDEAVAGDSTFGIERLSRLSAVENIARNASLEFQIQNLLRLYEQRRELTAGALGFQERNPRVQALDQRIEAAHGSLRNAVRAAQRSLNVRLAAIEEKIDEVRASLRSIPGMESRIAQLELEKSIQEQTTRYLLGQYESARMQVATIAPYVTILDGASPPYRIGTSIRQKIVLGLLVGLLLGLAGAFFLEYLDQTIKSSRDLERVLGVPVLGMIPYDPKLAGGASGRRRPITLITSLGPDDPIGEAFRTLRTNVTFVSAEKPLQFIALTSPGPGEGKSTTAVNLAVTLAQGGNRTVLIDGDLRRPLVHRAFAIVREPGLTDVLVGEAATREAIRPEVLPKLDVLPAGSSPPNPSELLGSDAMHTLIADLRRDYDYIVIDTPPILSVTDATVIATTTDAVILTIRSGDTEEAPARQAIDQLRRINARVAGAVLNAVTRLRDQSYAYYNYQRNVPYLARSPRRSIKARLADLF